MKDRFSTKKALIASLGSAAFLAGGVASAGTLFQSTDIGSGYAVDDEQIQLAEGKCGEGKCGGGEGDKDAEGKCGEGKCGGDGDKDAEGKCGEGKCGG